jgi:Ca2+-binding RTX toxin-like protein
VDLNGAGVGTGFSATFPGDGDFVSGSPGDDMGVGAVTGTPRDDVLLGLTGNDELVGGPGSDALVGGPGDDTLTGGGSVSGSAGVAIADIDVSISDVDDGNIESATIRLTNPQDGAAESLSLTMAGANLASTLVITVQPYNPGTGELGLTGTATLAEYQELLQEVVYQNASSDPTSVVRTIETVVNDGNDASNVATTTVVVSLASDTFIGGAGDDTLNGSVADDLFVFGPGSGQDTINNFTPGAGSEDAIDLRAFGLADFNDVQATQNGANTVIDLGGGDSITLIGVNVGDLHPDDFLL